MDRDEIWDRFVARGVTEEELLKLSIEQSWDQIDRENGDPPLAEIVQAIYTTALEWELFGAFVGTRDTVEIARVRGYPATIEAIHLGADDGPSIAYRLYADSTVGHWQLGDTQDAVTEAIKWYVANAVTEGTEQ